MFSLEISLLGLALAMDAAAVCFAMSLMQKDLQPNHRMQRGLILSTAFGLFQFLMLWLGSYVGYLFTFSNFGYFFHFGVGVIFLFLALKCLLESYKLEEKELQWGLLPLLGLAFLTSIDALASGVSLATLPHPYFAGMEVGAITFFVCLSFYFMAQFFTTIPDKWLLRLAAGIFAWLGFDILWAIRELLFRG